MGSRGAQLEPEGHFCELWHRKIRVYERHQFKYWRHIFGTEVLVGFLDHFVRWLVLCGVWLHIQGGLFHLLAFCVLLSTARLRSFQGGPFSDQYLRGVFPCPSATRLLGGAASRRNGADSWIRQDLQPLLFLWFVLVAIHSHSPVTVLALGRGAATTPNLAG